MSSSLTPTLLAPPALLPFTGTPNLSPAEANLVAEPDIDGLGCSPDGEPVTLPNAICMHEQDAGIGWKHTNVRTGRADVTRARELVLQLILTVGNYEYALYWIFVRILLMSYVTCSTLLTSVARRAGYRRSSSLGGPSHGHHVGHAH